MSYYKPWNSDEEPKLPLGWGLAVIQRLAPDDYGFNCEGCGKRIEWKEQYVYSFQKDGTPVRHNTEECTKELRG